MSKRSAPSSPVEEHHDAKKIKVGSPATPSVELPDSRPQEQQVDDVEIVIKEEPHSATLGSVPFADVAAEQIAPEVESPAMPGSTEAAEAKKPKKKVTARKAGDGFRPWKPKPAYRDIPEVEPHWGIVPRPGGYERPSQPQPPASTTDGAIRPRLWEDRKGAVRLKRGSRYIGDYDQAYHMWLPLMDLRPISTKKQQPRRIPVGYYYPHGMPMDWNNTAALNDVNKALQEAIRSKSNKEPPFRQQERIILAKIFAEDPDVSMLDAAERFNERAYPIAMSDEGSYPVGRFTESIQHEFRTYRSSYVKGEAPTDKTAKDIPLEVKYKEWKAEQAKAKATAKKARKQATSGKMSDTAGVTKKRSTKTPSLSPTTQAALDARMAATYEAFMEEKNAAKAAAAAGEALELADAPIPMAEQPRLSDEDEEILNLGGAYAPEEARPASPVSASAHAVVSSPSYGTKEAAEIVEETKQADEKDQIDPEVLRGDTIEQAEVVATVAEVTSTFVAKAVRHVEIDGSYDDEEEEIL